MLRRLSTLAAAASLVLCVATCVLWARSYWRVTNVSYVSDPPRGWSVGAYDGIIIASEWDRFPGAGGWRVWDAAIPNPRLPDRHGSIFPGTRFGGRPGARYVGLSFFYPAALACVFPLVYAYRRSRRHVRAGRCPASGSYLRAAPGRCPECGAVPHSEPKSESARGRGTP